MPPDFPHHKSTSRNRLVSELRSELRDEIRFAARKAAEDSSDSYEVDDLIEATIVIRIAMHPSCLGPMFKTLQEGAKELAPLASGKVISSDLWLNALSE